MKFLRISAVLLISLFITSLISFQSASAEKFQLPKYENPGNYNPKVLIAEPGPNDLKKSGNMLQGVNWTTIDSLGNPYSYFFANTNQPFVYETNTNTLITIKRGFVDLLLYPNYQGDNTKNNIFIRTSDNWGKTWAAPIKVYDQHIHGMGEGRYPSCYGFVFEGELSIGYTASLVDEVASTWYGFADGFYSDTYGANNIHTDKNFLQSGSVYEWSTSSAMLGGAILGDINNPNDDNFFTLSVGAVSSAAQDLADASNIALRRAVALEGMVEEIPGAWASYNFHAVTQTGYRANEVVALDYGSNGDMYMAALGNFDTGTEQAARPGVSISRDSGVTWEQFIIMPIDVLYNYTTSLGCPTANGRFDYDSKGFVTLDNGDFSFVMQYNSYNVVGTDTTNYHHIVESYYKDGEWGIRKISDYTGYRVVYWDLKSWNGTDSIPTNPMDIELQMAKTVDGSKIIAKWVEVVARTPDPLNSDIMVSVRAVDSDKWMTPVNVTESSELDRSTYLPDLVPNDLTDIPILKMVTFPDPAQPNETTNQLTSKREQYLQVGHFNVVVGVDDGKEPKEVFDITGIFPNPASNEAKLNFVVGEYGKVKVEIFDVLGNLNAKYFDDYKAAGAHSIMLNTAGLSVGAYYCTLTAGANKVTKMFTIIR